MIGVIRVGDQKCFVSIIKMLLNFFMCEINSFFRINAMKIKFVAKNSQIIKSSPWLYSAQPQEKGTTDCVHFIIS